MLGYHTIQVVECRRILKWTYAYGYYRFGDNISEEDSAQKQQQGFFEFNQVRALTRSFGEPLL